MVYALIDKATLDKKGWSISKISQKIEKLNIKIAQYRDKESSLQKQLDNIIEIKKFYSGKLIINDNIELIDYVDGLHIGQDDIREFNQDLQKATVIIRDIIGEKILGLSTHNLKEIEEANLLNLDYIGVGAYRKTSTKTDAKIYGDRLLEIAKESKHDVAIIGGVKLSDNFPSYIKYRVIGSNLYED